ncbi:GNAT family N-acetyltransferase, partial [Candidatus Woesearchaeota archaeon]|nr:GNAT family N-acetyltransferase [Candidatus Woesearchaeota archaeon]
ETPEEVVGGALWYYFIHKKVLGPQLFIDRLYVDPKYRGRSYGEALVIRVLDLEESSCTHAQLVAPENVIGFYRKLQFSVIQTFRDEELQGRKFALMSRPL